jgi:hypothetical protein
MAASTEPEQRLECLPNTKEENFRPLGSSGLHESRVFLITDSLDLITNELERAV